MRSLIGQSPPQSVLKAVNSECSSVESLADFCRSPCILVSSCQRRRRHARPPPTTWCRKVLLDHLGERRSLEDSLACHRASTFMSKSVSSGFFGAPPRLAPPKFKRYLGKSLICEIHEILRLVCGV